MIQKAFSIHFKSIFASVIATLALGAPASANAGLCFDYFAGNPRASLVKTSPQLAAPRTQGLQRYEEGRAPDIARLQSELDHLTTKIGVDGEISEAVRETLQPFFKHVSVVLDHETNRIEALEVTFGKTLNLIDQQMILIIRKQAELAQENDPRQLRAKQSSLEYEIQRLKPLRTLFADESRVLEQFDISISRLHDGVAQTLAALRKSEQHFKALVPRNETEKRNLAAVLYEIRSELNRAEELPTMIAGRQAVLKVTLDKGKRTLAQLAQAEAPTANTSPPAKIESGRTDFATLERVISENKSDGAAQIAIGIINSRESIEQIRFFERVCREQDLQKFLPQFLRLNTERVWRNDVTALHDALIETVFLKESAVSGSKEAATRYFVNKTLTQTQRDLLLKSYLDGQIGRASRLAQLDLLMAHADEATLKAVQESLHSEMDISVLEKVQTTLQGLEGKLSPALTELARSGQDEARVRVESAHSPEVRKQIEAAASRVEATFKSRAYQATQEKIKNDLDFIQRTPHVIRTQIALRLLEKMHEVSTRTLFAKDLSSHQMSFAKLFEILLHERHTIEISTDRFNTWFRDPGQKNPIRLPQAVLMIYAARNLPPMIVRKIIFESYQSYGLDVFDRPHPAKVSWPFLALLVAAKRTRDAVAHRGFEDLYLTTLPGFKGWNLMRDLNNVGKTNESPILAFLLREKIFKSGPGLGDLMGRALTSVEMSSDPKLLQAVREQIVELGENEIRPSIEASLLTYAYLQDNRGVGIDKIIRIPLSNYLALYPASLPFLQAFREKLHRSSGLANPHWNYPTEQMEALKNIEEKALGKSRE